MVFAISLLCLIDFNRLCENQVMFSGVQKKESTGNDSSLFINNIELKLKKQNTLFFVANTPGRINLPQLVEPELSIIEIFSTGSPKHTKNDLSSEHRQMGFQNSIFQENEISVGKSKLFAPYTKCDEDLESLDPVCESIIEKAHDHIFLSKTNHNPQSFSSFLPINEYSGKFDASHNLDFNAQKVTTHLPTFDLTKPGELYNVNPLSIKFESVAQSELLNDTSGLIQRDSKNQFLMRNSFKYPRNIESSTQAKKFQNSRKNTEIFKGEKQEALFTPYNILPVKNQKEGMFDYNLMHGNHTFILDSEPEKYYSLSDCNDIDYSKSMEVADIFDSNFDSQKRLIERSSGSNSRSTDLQRLKVRKKNLRLNIYKNKYDFLNCKSKKLSQHSDVIEDSILLRKESNMASYVQIPSISNIRHSHWNNYDSSNHRKPDGEPLTDGNKQIQSLHPYASPIKKFLNHGFKRPMRAIKFQKNSPFVLNNDLLTIDANFIGFREKSFTSTKNPLVMQFIQESTEQTELDNKFKYQGLKNIDKRDVTSKSNFMSNLSNNYGKSATEKMLDLEFDYEKALSSIPSTISTDENCKSSLNDDLGNFLSNTFNPNIFL